MIKHYLKVAFRNLMKYKMQSFVSIIGLAVGFTCFALSALWIRYEMTYDNFHKGSDRIYMVRAHYANEPGTSKFTPYPLMEYLQDKMPEIEAATAFTPHHVKFRLEETEQEVGMIDADSVFMNFFDIQLLKGTVNFLKSDGQEVAITKEFAKRLFSKEEDALGKEVEVGRRVCKIGAIVSGWSNHSNIPYNILAPARHSPQWGSSNEQLLIRVRERTDIDAFRTKMSTVCINDIEKESELSDLLITRMSALRYSDYVDKADVVISFSYIFYFSLAGGLRGEYPIFACHALHYIYVYVCFPIGSRGPLRLFPVHRSRFYRQLLYPAMGRVDGQHSGFDRKQRSYKRNDRYRPFTYFYQYHHATIVMGCILGKYPGHPYRIDGNEKGQTGK